MRLALAALIALCACDASAPVIDAPGGGDADAAVAAPADAGGAPDAAVPDGGPVVLPPAALFEVVPPRAGTSVETAVELRGEGFTGVLRVEVGGVAATGVSLVDSHTVRATFLPVPPAEAGRKLVSVVLADGQVALLRDGFEYFFDEDPVVFVHGFMLTPFGLMIDRFREAGYPDSHLWRIEYSEVTGSNLRNVDELSAYVARVLDETGAPRVDLVAHSMGGLSTRLFIKQGGWAFVRDYVSVAGAHHGTSAAWAWFSDGAKEMRPPYACEGDSLNDVQFRLNGCLTDAGRSTWEDETPFGVEDGGPVSYLSVSSEMDEMILPTHSSCLNQRKKGDCSDPVNVRVSWLGHGTICTDKDVTGMVLAHLRARNRSRP